MQWDQLWGEEVVLLILKVKKLSLCESDGVFVTRSVGRSTCNWYLLSLFTPLSSCHCSCHIHSAIAHTTYLLPLVTADTCCCCSLKIPPAIVHASCPALLTPHTSCHRSCPRVCINCLSLLSNSLLGGASMLRFLAFQSASKQSWEPSDKWENNKFWVVYVTPISVSLDLQILQLSKLSATQGGCIKLNFEIFFHKLRNER